MKRRAIFLLPVSIFISVFSLNIVAGGKTSQASTLLVSQPQSQEDSGIEETDVIDRQQIEDPEIIAELDEIQKLDEEAVKAEQELIGYGSEKDLEKFLKTLSGAFKPDTKDFASIKTVVNDGTAVITAIFTDNTKAIKEFQGVGLKDKEASRIHYLNSILNLCWAFYSGAVAKGQGFTGGTMVVEDPDNYLYRFLLGYVELMNKEVEQGTAKVSYVSKNPYAYRRTSSHFKEVKEPQYGIDIDADFKPENDIQYFPTANKPHLVFGKAGKNLTFIKFETHGLYGIASAAAHLKEFAKKKIGIKEVGGIGRREDVKNLPIIKDLEKFKKDKKNKQCESAEFIRDYYKCVDSSLKSKLLQSFDNLSLRRGNEVIFSKDEVHKLTGSVIPQEYAALINTFKNKLNDPKTKKLVENKDLCTVAELQTLGDYYKCARNIADDKTVDSSIRNIAKNVMTKLKAKLGIK